VQYHNSLVFTPCIKILPLGDSIEVYEFLLTIEVRVQTRSPVIGRKADRTAYDVRHSCRKLSGIAIGIGQLGTMALSGVQISAV